MMISWITISSDTLRLTNLDAEHLILADGLSSPIPSTASPVADFHLIQTEMAGQHVNAIVVATAPTQALGAVVACFPVLSIFVWNEERT